MFSTVGTDQNDAIILTLQSQLLLRVGFAIRGRWRRRYNVVEIFVCIAKDELVTEWNSQAAKVAEWRRITHPARASVKLAQPIFLPRHIPELRVVDRVHRELQFASGHRRQRR